MTCIKRDDITIWLQLQLRLVCRKTVGKQFSPSFKIVIANGISPS